MNWFQKMMVGILGLDNLIKGHAQYQTESWLRHWLVGELEKEGKMRIYVESNIDKCIERLTYARIKEEAESRIKKIVDREDFIDSVVERIKKKQLPQ